MLPILFEILQSLGLLSLLILAYGFISREVKPHHWRRLLLSAVFSLGAVIAINVPHEVMPGIVVDARGVVLGLAAPFGGPVAAAAAAVSASAARILTGGVGTSAGVVGIVVAAGAGMIFQRVVVSDGQTLGPRRLALLGLMVSTFVLSVLLVPGDRGQDLLVEVAPVIAVATIIGIVLLGSFLDHERRRVAEEEAWKNEAGVDPLTGLANRRAFTRAAARFISYARRHNQPVSLLAIDCDHFKSVNDTFGHPVGDKVLVEVARAMQDMVRKDDIVARLGGEEFSVLLPGTPAHKAAGLAERLRERIMNTEILADHRAIRVTVSIGIAELHRRHDGLTDILHDADRALYRAKKNGRNRIEIEGELSAA